MIGENERVLSTFLRYQRQHPKDLLPSVAPSRLRLDISKVIRIQVEIGNALNHPDQFFAESGCQ